MPSETDTCADAHIAQTPRNTTIAILVATIIPSEKRGVRLNRWAERTFVQPLPQSHYSPCSERHFWCAISRGRFVYIFRCFYSQFGRFGQMLKRVGAEARCGGRQAKKKNRCEDAQDSKSCGKGKKNSSFQTLPSEMGNVCFICPWRKSKR